MQSVLSLIWLCVTNMIITTQTQISSSGPAAVLPPAPFPSSIHRPFGCLPVLSLDILTVVSTQPAVWQ